MKIFAVKGTAVMVGNYHIKCTAMPQCNSDESEKLTPLNCWKILNDVSRMWKAFLLHMIQQAWITKPTFENFLLNWMDMYSEKQDTCSLINAHSTLWTVKLQNMRVEYFPAKCTSNHAIRWSYKHFKWTIKTSFWNCILNIEYGFWSQVKVDKCATRPLYDFFSNGDSVTSIYSLEWQ